MGDAEVEGAQQHGAAVLAGSTAAEILPQPERQRRQLQAAAPQRRYDIASYRPPLAAYTPGAVIYFSTGRSFGSRRGASRRK